MPDLVPARSEVVEVWSCNMDAVQVFQLCRIDVTVGMAAYYGAISAQECTAALRLAGIPRSRWSEVGQDVIVMGRAAARWLNEQAAKRK